jgi:hypothetical protein
MLKNMKGLPGVSILGKAAQKQLRGGDSIGGGGTGSGTCAIYLPPGYGQGTGNVTLVPVSANDWYHNSNGSDVLVGISKATVTQLINAGGGVGVQWCCSSCASANWVH